jgi:hypothetical protein
VGDNAKDDGGMKDFVEPKLFRPRVRTLSGEDGGTAKVGSTTSNESNQCRFAPNSHHRRGEDGASHPEHWVEP